MAAKNTLTHKVVLTNGLTHGVRLKGKSVIFRKGTPAYVTEEIAESLAEATNQATQVVGDKVSQVDQPRFTITKLETPISSKEAVSFSSKSSAAKSAATEVEEDEDEEEGSEGGSGTIRDR